MKTCTKCNQEKELTEFHLEKRRHGYRPICKMCASADAKIWRAANMERERITGHLWYEKHKEKRLEQCKAYQSINKEKRRAASKVWQKANPEKCAERRRRYRQNNLEKCREKARIKQLEIRGTLHGKINDSLSSGIRRSLKSNKNGYKWETLVGYSWEQLKKHLEKQFQDGMNWNKFMSGDIHIDHKIPLCAFNFSSFEDIDFKRAWALSNLQPLWKHDNLVKHGKVQYPFQPSFAMAV